MRTESACSSDFTGLKIRLLFCYNIPQRLKNTVFISLTEDITLTLSENTLNQAPVLSHNNPCFQINTAITNFLVSNTTAGNHVTQQQQQWPIFEKNPWLQVRKSSIIPLIHDRLEFGLKQRRRKDSRDLLDVLFFFKQHLIKKLLTSKQIFYPG